MRERTKQRNKECCTCIPVHEVGGALVGPEEEDLLAVVMLHHALARQHQVNQRVHIFAERDITAVLKNAQNNVSKYTDLCGMTQYT